MSLPRPGKTEVKPASEIEPGLYLANGMNTYDKEFLGQKCITGVVSLVGNGCSLWQMKKFANFVGHHMWIRCDDSLTQDLLKHMNIFCDFLDAVYSAPLRSDTRPVDNDYEGDFASMWLPLFTPQGKHTTDVNVELVHRRPTRNASFVKDEFPVEAGSPETNVMLVHCEQGVSRSPTMVIAYLMRKYGKSRDAVLADVKAKRRIKPNKNFMDQLQVWEDVEYQPWEDEARTVPKAPYKAYLERRAVVLKEKGLTGDELPGIQSLDF